MNKIEHAFSKKSDCYLCNRMVSYIFETIRLHIFIVRRDVFQAIADPTRRQIISMISHQSLNLNAVADHFDISRPAISKHIKILTECGLIVIKQRGRERFCEAHLQKLNEVHHWTEQFQAFWAAKFDALETFLEKDPGKNTNHKTIKKRR